MAATSTRGVDKIKEFYKRTARKDEVLWKKRTHESLSLWKARDQKRGS